LLMRSVGWRACSLAGRGDAPDQELVAEVTITPRS
jgi:hypothetical protein